MYACGRGSWLRTAMASATTQPTTVQPRKALMTTQRRRLRSGLRLARQDAGLTQEHVVIHGLLQTEEYAALVIREYNDELHAGQQADRRVELRMKRQELLARPQPPELIILHDESALRRCVGSPAVMRRQLRHLAELADRPSITLEVIPFSAGVRNGIGVPFAILDFPDPDDPALFLEPRDTVREDRSERASPSTRSASSGSAPHHQGQPGLPLSSDPLPGR
jgi:Domain of unknown function (DUF5753)